MVEVSIICLVYKSKQLAEALYKSLYDNTPMLKNGRAELILVANDPTEELVDFLKKKQYPHLINVNQHLSEKEMLKLGFGKPEYIRRVYQGYNRGIMEAKGHKICLINSDNFFAPDWLENLLKYLDYKTIVSSTLVEPGHKEFGVFPFAVEAKFGGTVDDFQEKKFYQFAAKMSKTGWSSGGAYMPCLLYKDVAFLVGLYPEGNLVADGDFQKISMYGDEAFYDRLRRFGIKHITAKDSIVYHLKEGEKSDADSGKIITDKKYLYKGLGMAHQIDPTESINYIMPDARHVEVMNKLGRKFTILISDYIDSVDLRQQIQRCREQTEKNIEIVVIHKKSVKIGQRQAGVKYVELPIKNYYEALSEFLHHMYGEYLLFYKPFFASNSNLLSSIDCKHELYRFSGLSNDELSGVSIKEFVIHKRILTKRANYYADLIISGLKANFKEFSDRICYLDGSVMINDDTSQDYQDTGYKMLIYKVARKVRRDGVKGAARAAYTRLKKK